MSLSNSDASTKEKSEARPVQKIEADEHDEKNNGEGRGEREGEQGGDAEQDHFDPKASHEEDEIEHWNQPWEPVIELPAFPSLEANDFAHVRSREPRRADDYQSVGREKDPRERSPYADRDIESRGREGSKDYEGEDPECE